MLESSLHLHRSPWMLTANVGLQLTALSVRSHWKTIFRICVRMVLLALARSIFLTPASATQLWYCSWASSAWPKQENIHNWGIVQLMHLIGLVLEIIHGCASYSVTFTFCRASSSSLLFFSSCLFIALDCSSRERLVEDWAFSYSSLLCVFSARAFRKAASASCCQNHKSNDNPGCD